MRQTKRKIGGEVQQTIDFVPPLVLRLIVRIKEHVAGVQVEEHVATVLIQEPGYSSAREGGPPRRKFALKGGSVQQVEELRIRKILYLILGYDILKFGNLSFWSVQF